MSRDTITEHYPGVLVAALAMAYPKAKTIHLVIDNLNIQRRKTLVDAFGAEIAAEVWDRFTVHYTPAP